MNLPAILFLAVAVTLGATPPTGTLLTPTASTPGFATLPEHWLAIRQLEYDIDLGEARQLVRVLEEGQTLAQANLDAANAMPDTNKTKASLLVYIGGVNGSLARLNAMLYLSRAKVAALEAKGRPTK